MDELVTTYEQYESIKHRIISLIEKIGNYTLISNKQKEIYQIDEIEIIFYSDYSESSWDIEYVVNNGTIYWFAINVYESVNSWNIIEETLKEKYKYKLRKHKISKL